MNNLPQIPEPKIREASIKKMSEITSMFDSQIIILDELIARIEAQNCQSLARVYRQIKGEKLLNSLDK